MKTTLVLLLALTVRCFADDLTTLDNKNYSDVRVTATNVDGLMIVHSAGGGKVLFTNLPVSWQKKYGYDPVKAAEFAAKQAKIKKMGRLGAVYRLSELKEAQEEAKRDGKPIAFLATYINYLQSKENMQGPGSGSATVQVFEALKNDTVLVFSDSERENHTEPAMVDANLHSPDDVHFTVPKVVITDAAVKKVIAVVPYRDTVNARAQLLGEALAKIKAWKK